MNNRIISPLASFISTKTSLDFSNNFPNDLTITHSLNFLNPRIICDRSISSFFSFFLSIYQIFNSLPLSRIILDPILPHFPRRKTRKNDPSLV